MSAQELNNFPRLIVDISDWNSMERKQVAQICVLNNGKKSFVNVEIERSQFPEGKDNAYCIVSNVSRDSDRVKEVPCVFNMDANGDEHEVLNAFKVKV